MESMATAAETLQQGWRIHQSGNFAAAEQTYRTVLRADSNNANAWCYLGIACYDQDRFDEAVASYQRAIQIQPQFPIAYNNLGNTLRMQKRLTEALACFDEALRQQPGYVNAHKNKGTALVWEGRLDEALESYGQALQLAPEDAETHKNLGVIRLLKGQFAEGWREYRWRWRTQDLTPPKYDRPEWDGSSLDGKTILLVAEQGLGDTIHFIRYGGVLKQRYTCRVVVACHRPLLALMADCSGIDALVAIDEPPPAFDVFCPLLDVPGVLGEDLQCTPGQVPYLSARPELVEQWRERLSVYGGLKIGIAWQGNPKYPADRMRSFPLSALEPLGRLHGIQLFSLQRDAGVEQLDTLAGRLDIVPLGAGTGPHHGRIRRDRGGAEEPGSGHFARYGRGARRRRVGRAALAGAVQRPALALVAGPRGHALVSRRAAVPPARGRRLDKRLRADGRATRRRQARRPVEGVRRVPDGRLRSQPPDPHATRSDDLQPARPYIGRSLERYGEFSEGECDLLRQMVRPGQVVVEAGANIGAHTLVLSQLVGPAGRVYAFEPQRVVFQILCGNLALNGCLNVVCREVALGDQPGQLRVPPIDYQRENNFGGVELRGTMRGNPSRSSPWTAWICPPAIS
jgi:Flp pilus assembly protein TadD